MRASAKRPSLEHPLTGARIDSACVSAEAAMVAEFSDLPLIMRARKYRDMAVKARSEAQAATWFAPRWSHMHQAKHWEDLAHEALRELRTELVRANRAMQGY